MMKAADALASGSPMFQRGMADSVRDRTLALVPPAVTPPIPPSVALPAAPAGGSPRMFPAAPASGPFGNQEEAQEQRALRVDFLLFGSLRDVPGQALRQTFRGQAMQAHYETAIQRALLGDRRDAVRTARDTFSDAERGEISAAVAKVAGELIGEGIPFDSNAFGTGIRSAFDLANGQINARRRARGAQSTPEPASGSTPAPSAPLVGTPKAIPPGLSPEQLASRIGDYLPRAGSNPPAVYGTNGGEGGRKAATGFNRANYHKVAIPLEVEANIGGQKMRTWVVYSKVDPASTANLARNVDATDTFTVLNRDTALRDAGLSPDGLAARARRREDGAFARDLPVIGGRKMLPLMDEQAYADARATVRGNNASAIAQGRIDSLDLLAPMAKGRGAFVQGVSRGEAASLLDALQRNGSLRPGVSPNDVIAANGLGALLGTDARGRAFVRETPQALNAPGATPEVTALPRETGGAAEAEKRNKSVGEAWERAGRTLEDLKRAASQPVSEGIDELVKDKADQMRGEGDGLDALMLEMAHHSRSAFGNVVGAHGGSRSAPGVSSAELNRIRNTEAGEMAAIVNRSRRESLDALPDEFRDAMRQSLQRAEPSEAITQALRKLGPKADAAQAQALSPARPAPINGTVVEISARPDLIERAKEKLIDLLAAAEAPGGMDDPRVLDRADVADQIFYRLLKDPEQIFAVLDHNGTIAGLGAYSISRGVFDHSEHNILYAEALLRFGSGSSGIAEKLLEAMFDKAPRNVMRLRSLNPALDEHYKRLGGQRIDVPDALLNVFEWRKPPAFTPESSSRSSANSTGRAESCISDEAVTNPLRVLDSGLPANPRDLGIMQYVQGESFESARVQRAGQSGVRPVDTGRLSLDEAVFPVGKPVTGDFIRSLTSVNGMPVEKLQESMYPDPGKTDRSIAP